MCKRTIHIPLVVSSPTGYARSLQDCNKHTFHDPSGYCQRGIFIYFYAETWLQTFRILRHLANFILLWYSNNLDLTDEKKCNIEDAMTKDGNTKLVITVIVVAIHLLKTQHYK
jgi:hypothetical protein